MLWLGVGLVLSLLVAALGVFWGVSRANDRAHDRRQSELAEVATLPGGLIEDLQNERSLSILTLTGLVELVELPLDTLEAARIAVDRSTATFDDAISGNETAVAAYDQAMDALSELHGIRAEVDQNEASPSLGNLPAALRVQERYSEVIAAFMDGTTRLVVSLDEGDLRRGVKLIDLATRQIETATVLIARLAFAAVEHDGRLVDDRGEPANRELVAEIRWQSGDLRTRRTEISELGTDEYEASTTTALQESYEWGFEEVVASILDGETFTASSVLEFVGGPDPDAGYSGLRNDVEELLR